VVNAPIIAKIIKPKQQHTPKVTNKSEFTPTTAMIIINNIINKIVPINIIPPSLIIYDMLISYL
jgi:hypothetical protein